MDSEKIFSLLRARAEHNASFLKAHAERNVRQLDIVKKVVALENDRGMISSVDLEGSPEGQVDMIVYLNRNFRRPSGTSFFGYLIDRGLTHQDGSSLGFKSTERDDGYLLRYDDGVNVRFVNKDSDEKAAA